MPKNKEIIGAITPEMLEKIKKYPEGYSNKSDYTWWAEFNFKYHPKLGSIDTKLGPQRVEVSSRPSVSKVTWRSIDIILRETSAWDTYKDFIDQPASIQLSLKSNSGDTLEQWILDDAIIGKYLLDFIYSDQGYRPRLKFTINYKKCKFLDITNFKKQTNLMNLKFPFGEISVKPDEVFFEEDDTKVSFSDMETWISDDGFWKDALIKFSYNKDDKESIEFIEKLVSRRVTPIVNFATPIDNDSIGEIVYIDKQSKMNCYKNIVVVGFTFEPMDDSYQVTLKVKYKITQEVNE